MPATPRSGPGPRPCAVRLRAVLVTGPSMEPTLHDGDCLLVAWGARARAGDVVVARPWARPELLVVKRAVAPSAGGWLVDSDNEAVRGAGWTGGGADVLGRVLLRYWPLPFSRVAARVR